MVNDVAKHIKLDLSRNRGTVVVYARYADTKTHNLHIAVTNNGNLVSLTDAVAAIMYIKLPSGTKYANSLVRIGNELRYTFQTQDLAEVGDATAQVYVAFKDGSKFTTPEFTVEVYKNIDDLDVGSLDAESENTYQAVSDILSEANTTAELAQQIATTAKYNADEFAEQLETAEGYVTTTKEYMETTESLKDDVSTMKTSVETTKAAVDTAKSEVDTTKAAVDTIKEQIDTEYATMQTLETSASESATASSESATASANSATAAATSQEKALSSETAASTSASNAATSEGNAASSESNAATSESNAATSEANAKTYRDYTETVYNSVTGTKTSIDNIKSDIDTKYSGIVEMNTTVASNASSASSSATAAATSENNADTYATKSKSYAVGGTGTRTGEDTDNANYYYEQAKKISEGLAGSLLPMGTITFSQLSSQTKVSGCMYNISDGFDSTTDFKDGGGIHYPAGTNVYCTSDGMWDCLAGATSTMDSALNTVTFEEASTRENIVTGENHMALFGKIKKWFSSLGTAAFKDVTDTYSATGSDPVDGKAVASAISGKADSATTLSGYGIGDAYTKTETDDLLDDKVDTTDSRLSDSRKASDVYSWAKASTKPSYTASEVSIGTTQIVSGKTNVYDTVKSLSETLSNLIVYEDYSVTTVANSVSKLGYYGSVDVYKLGYTPISAIIVGASSYQGYVTQNGTRVCYVWTVSADTYTIRVMFLKTS